MIKNRKGFTLIELIVTIVIVSLVLSITTFGIISIIDKSKEEGQVLSLNGITTAAATYSSETQDGWISDTGTGYDAFCVTIGELINRGLLEKDANMAGGKGKNDFVIVKRNSETLAIMSKEFANDSVENREICNNDKIDPQENVKVPKINGTSPFTNKIQVSFTNGSATDSAGKDVVKEHKCYYCEGKSNCFALGKAKEGKITSTGTCEFSDGVRPNTMFWVKVQMITEHGRYSSELVDVQASDLVKPTIEQKVLKVNITYNDKDTNGNEIPGSKHYFKSEKSGTSNRNVQKCTLDSNGIFTCSGNNTTSLSPDTWYKVNETTIEITYDRSVEESLVTAEIRDASDNGKTSEFTYKFKEYNINFCKNAASKVGTSTSDCVKVTCTTDDNGNCYATSPTITPGKAGFVAVGFNKDASGKSSEWGANEKKIVTEDSTYYAIIKKDVTIKFNKNAASSLSAYEKKCTMWNSDTSCLVTSPTITAGKTGFVAVGFNTSSNGTSSSWNVQESKQVSEDGTYNAIIKKDVKVTFDVNTAESLSSYEEKCTIWNSSTGCSITSPQITPKDNYMVVGFNTSKTATTSTWNQNTLKSDVSGDATYYAITEYGKIITVTFDKNAASSISKTSETCTVPSGQTGCYVTTPTIDAGGLGYSTAIGWSRSASSHYAEANVNSRIYVTDNVVYYALVRTPLTLYFYQTGSSSSVYTSKSCYIYNSEWYCEISSLPSATRSGYTFKGWTESTDGSGILYRAGETYDMYVYWGISQILYGQWTSNGGSSGGGGSGGTTPTPTPGGSTGNPTSSQLSALNSLCNSNKTSEMFGTEKGKGPSGSGNFSNNYGEWVPSLWGDTYWCNQGSGCERSCGYRQVCVGNLCTQNNVYGLTANQINDKLKSAGYSCKFSTLHCSCSYSCSHGAY